MKDPEKVKARFAFAFPDLYEIGMSYMGLQILYHILNRENDIYCEREFFAPAPDMESLMREEQMPLFTLETKDADQRYGFLRGLHCSMKMSFTSILDMLELAGIPLKSTDRSEVDPIIIAGDPAPLIQNH